MSEIEDYRAFVAIVERGSLTAAAAQLGRSLQAVSRSLQMLEEQLGVELVARTTRRCRPTQAGEDFHRRLKGILADLDSARAAVAEEGALISGRIRVAASSRFGVAYVLPIMAAFMERHPGVEIDLSLDDRYVDLLAENFDLSVQFGQLSDSSLKAKRLGLIRRVVFASSRYLAAHGRPSTPADLKQHDCVARLTHHSTDTWRFGEGAAEVEIPVKGRFRSDSAPARIAAVVEGLGIGLAPLYQIRPLLDAGQVELLLPGFEPTLTPVHLVWLPGTMPLRLRRLIDFIATRLSLAGV